MIQALGRILLPLYGLLLIFGGIKGKQIAKSDESLYAGVGSGIVTLLLALLSLKQPRIAMALAALVAAALTGIMGWRFEKTGRVMPAGLVAGSSLVVALVEGMGALRGTE